MVNYYIYAKDTSGSTGGVKYYHTNGLLTYYQFKKDVKDSSSSSDSQSESREIYMHWNTECSNVNEDAIVESYKEQKGRGGTEPQTIIKWIIKNINLQNDTIKLLYIITDGMIPLENVESSAQLNANINYDSVVFHAFNQNLNSIDLSVASAFLKSQCVIYRNHVLMDDVNIAEDFDYDSIKLDNFYEEKEQLKSYIKLKFLVISNNTLALKEIDKLKTLRNRLLNDQLSAMELEKLKKINQNFYSKDKDVIIREFKETNYYKNLNKSNFYDLRVDIDKSISTLINYIQNDKKSYAFDALKFDSKFTNEVEEESMVDVDFLAAEEVEFPDIILYKDKGIPVILLTELDLLQKLIFHNNSTTNFSKFRSTMECPLFLTKDKDLNESIGYFYTLTAYKEFLANSLTLEPRTRKRFHGGIVLAEEFDKYNDYILSLTYFNSKKVNYNVALFYYVIWKMCATKKWMDRNVIDQLKKYVMRRISQYVCYIGLSSLPLDPKEIVPLPTALWYCVELSSYIFKNDDKFFGNERLRMYHGVANQIIEILELLDYDLDKEFIENRCDVFRHLSILKRIGPTREKMHFMLQKIFKNDNGFLVCEIEHPENVQKLNYLKLDHKKIVHEDVLDNKVDLEEYAYFLCHVDNITIKNYVKICEKTLRPFFVVNKNSSFYSELIKYTQQVVSVDNVEKIGIKFAEVTSLDFQRILSIYNLFIQCVNNSNKFPSLSDFMAFVLKKKQFREDLTVIFSKTVREDIEIVFSQYQNVIKNIDANEFIKRTNNSVNRSERIKLEIVKNFNNDDEIQKFILSEELKVNLRKVK